MKIIYIIEYINHLGGAHVATANLLAELIKRGVEIDVLTDCIPSRETLARFKGVHIIAMPLRRWTIEWIIRGLWRRMFHTLSCPDWALDPNGDIRKLLLSYNCVCVMSELSRYKRLVSQLPQSIRKVQLIHTDYLSMCKNDKYAKVACRSDRSIFDKMDVVGVVGHVNAQKLARAFPQLAPKITFFHNYMMQELPHRPVDCAEKLRIVSAFSFEGEAKDPVRVVEIAIRLVRLGVNIDWTFFGDGAMRYDLESKVARLGVQQRIHFAGIVQSPKQIFENADLFVLLSHYEGLPMVIYEALISGVPVFSTNVGGISEQISDGQNGWLVEDDARMIFEKLLSVVRNRRLILLTKQNLLSYRYDNEGAINEHLFIMGM